MPRPFGHVRTIVVETAGLEPNAGVASKPEAEARVDPARRPLIIAAIAASIAVTTGTFIFCYPNTLEAIRRGMIIVHDISGDITIVAAVWYLSIHLKRTWRMWRYVLSRWTGYVALTVWAVVAVTGVYGQIFDMPTESVMSWIHIASSAIAVVIVCFHGGYGLRRHFL